MSVLDSVGLPPVIRGMRAKFSGARLTRIGLAVVSLAAAAAVYFPQLLYTSSSEAVINARIVTITAPIGGRIAAAPPAEGSVVHAGAPLLTIKNPIVDRSRLEDLEAARTRTAGELAGEKSLIGSLSAELAALTEQARAYLAATVTRLSLAQQQAQADATADGASALEARHVFERKWALRGSGAVSPADIDEARQAAIRTAAITDRARLDAQSLGEELDAAKRGILVGADRNDVPYAQQRIDEFTIRRAEAQAQAATLSARLAQLDRQVIAERARTARLAATQLTAPATGVVWRPLITRGSAVARDSELMTLIDCSELYVTAAFSSSQFDDLRPGRRATVHVLGSATDYRATVVDTRAMQSSAAPDRFAAPVPKLGAHQVLAILRLDTPGALASTKYCNVGRRVDVRLSR